MELTTLFLSKVSFGTAFVAGLLSFATPCVLPLIPAWLTLVTGLNYKDLAEGGRSNLGRLFWPTLFFILGFSAVFCALGAAAGLVGGALNNYGPLLRYPAGTFMIFFGLYLTGIISPKFLMAEKRAHIKNRHLGLAGSFLVGMGFAAGWTPCVGPILTSILALAALEQSAGTGLKLLAVYSLGLGLPFIAVSLAWGFVWPWLNRLKPVFNWSGKVLGGLMIVIGILVISGRLSLGLL